MREQRLFYPLLFSSGKRRNVRDRTYGTVKARAAICRRFVAILMCRARGSRQRSSPAEQSSSFLLDARDNPDSVGAFASKIDRNWLATRCEWRWTRVLVADVCFSINVCKDIRGQTIREGEERCACVLLYSEKLNVET